MDLPQDQGCTGRYVRIGRTVYHLHAKSCLLKVEGDAISDQTHGGARIIQHKREGGTCCSSMQRLRSGEIALYGKKKRIPGETVGQQPGGHLSLLLKYHVVQGC